MKHIESMMLCQITKIASMTQNGILIYNEKSQMTFRISQIYKSKIKEMGTNNKRETNHQPSAEHIDRV